MPARNREIDTRKEYIIGLYENGESAVQIGSKFGVNHSTILKRLHEWGINIRVGKKRITTDGQDAEMIRLYQEGYTSGEIGKLFDVDYKIVWKRLQEERIDTSNVIDISPNQKDEIVVLHNAGYSINEISDMVGIKRGVIYRRLKQWGISPHKPGTTSRDRRINTINDGFFNIIATEKQAYWLGFISADGNVSGNRVTIHLKQADCDHLQNFIDDLDGTYRVRHNGRRATIRITSKELVANLKRCGVVPHKSLIIQPYQVARNLERHYWRGFFDGDGSVCVAGNGRPKISFAGSESVVTAFANWCRKYCQSMASVSPAGKIYVYQINGFYSIPILRKLYDDTEVFLERKYNLAQEIIEKWG